MREDFGWQSKETLGKKKEGRKGGGGGGGGRKEGRKEKKIKLERRKKKKRTKNTISESSLSLATHTLLRAAGECRCRRARAGCLWSRGAPGADLHRSYLGEHHGAGAATPYPITIR